MNFSSIFNSPVYKQPSSLYQDQFMDSSTTNKFEEQHRLILIAYRYIQPLLSNWILYIDLLVPINFRFPYLLQWYSSDYRKLRNITKRVVDRHDNTKHVSVCFWRIWPDHDQFFQISCLTKTNLRPDSIKLPTLALQHFLWLDSEKRSIILCSATQPGHFLTHLSKKCSNHEF